MQTDHGPDTFFRKFHKKHTTDTWTLLLKNNYMELEYTSDLSENSTSHRKKDWPFNSNNLVINNKKV